MKRFVIDASVASKWIVAEPDSDDAVALRQRCELMAPDLLIVECTNVIWKLARRGELTPAEAMSAVRLLMGVEIELVPMRALVPEAMRLAIALAHPAYDCAYLALAAAVGLPFVCSDGALLRKRAALGPSVSAPEVVSLTDAAASIARP